MGIVAVVFGVLPILGGAARVAVVVAGVLLLLAATSRRLSLSGDGGPAIRRTSKSRPVGVGTAGDPPS